MKNAIMDRHEEFDIIVMSAAVADYKATHYSDQKIKKRNEDLVIEFKRDSDILKLLGEVKKDNILVGFAAESNDLLENARGKLIKKNLDFIVANDISTNEYGFKSDFNKVTIMSRDGKELVLDKMTKREVAKNLFDTILKKSL